MSENNDKIIKAFVSINEQMEAHLVESIISLFHQGVLKHYVRNPRQILDERNFKMTIEAASGVTFEGREKIVELEKEVARLKEENLRMRNCTNCKHSSMLGKCLHPNHPATLNCRCNLWENK